MVIAGEPKSESSKRAVPINDEVTDLLKGSMSDSDNYLISDSKKPAEPRAVQYHYVKSLKRDKFTVITFHSLRHSFATKAIASGCDMKTLSEIMGHSSVEVTLNRYAHSSSERKRACIENMVWAA